MRRRPRPVHLLLALLAAAAACTGSLEAAPCPGSEVGTFALTATRRAASCQGDTVPLDGSAACLAATPSQVVDCQAVRPAPACCFDALYPPTRALTATLAYGTQGQTAALCSGRPGASPFLGTRAEVAGGEAVTVTLDTSGAVLASCASACAVTVHQAVTGLLARGPSGAPTGFTGVLVETDTATPNATCTPCAAPCTASWDLGPQP